MMDNETRTTLLDICKVLQQLTAVCGDINRDNQRLLEENYLLSQAIKSMNNRLKTHIDGIHIRGYDDPATRDYLDEINKDLFKE